VEPSEDNIYGIRQRSMARFWVQEDCVEVTLRKHEQDPKSVTQLNLVNYEERTLKSLDDLIILCDSIKDGSIVIAEYN